MEKKRDEAQEAQATAEDRISQLRVAMGKLEEDRDAVVRREVGKVKVEVNRLFGAIQEREKKYAKAQSCIAELEKQLASVGSDTKAQNAALKQHVQELQ